MPHNALFRAPFRLEADRNLALSHISRTGSRASTTSRRSAVRSASIANPVRSALLQIGEVALTEQCNPPIASSDIIEREPAVVERDDSSDDSLSEVVMAIDMSPQGTVGCCYYIAREEKLCFMEDVQLGDVQIVDTRKLALCAV